DYGHLRDDLLEDLLAAARRNLQSGADGFWAFGIGAVFSAADAGASRQLLAGVVCGERRAERWSSSGKPQAPGYFQARGLLQSALSSLAIPTDDRVLRDHPLLHPGRAAQIVVEGRPAGWFGQLHPQRCEELDLPLVTYGFQLDLASLLNAATRPNRWRPPFTPFPTVPAAERDLALVVPESTTAAALLAVIRKAGRPLLEQAELIDRYAGAQVENGQCSQAFRLRYRDPRRTLTDQDVERAHGAITAALAKQPGVRLRV
ncbi:MAG: phenylalanine--tRNA ligase subunit beta, partial [Cyanobacteriota bacterium]